MLYARSTDSLLLHAKIIKSSNVTFVQVKMFVGSRFTGIKRCEVILSMELQCLTNRTLLTKSSFSVRNYFIVVVCLVSFGLALQTRHLLLDRSLWLDEAFLSLAILERSLANLLTLPLPYGQTPPPLFLVLVKSLTTVAGTSEMALRAIPFLSSGLTLCLFPLFSRKHSRMCLLVGTFLLAVSYGEIYYAAEFKPYSTEALLSVLLLLAGMRLLQGGSIHHAIGWGLLFAIAPWLGFTTVFLLAGVAGGLLVVQLTARGRWLWQAWGLLLVGFLSLGVMYVLYALPASATQLQMDYWKAFAAPRMDFSQAIAWYGERASLVLCHFFGLQHTWQGAFLFGLASVGGLALLKRDPAYGLMLTLPIVGAVLLSMTGRFPLHERLLIFTLPLCCLLLAEGVVALGTSPGLLGAAKWLPAVGLLAILARPVASMVLDPSTFERQEFKKISEQILQRRTDGDAVFVFQAAVPLFQYYSRRDPRIATFQPLSIIRGNQSSFVEAIRTVKAAGHGWVLFAHVQHPEERMLQTAFEDYGEVRERLSVKGAWAFAFAVKSPELPVEPAQPVDALTK
jgi:hypothetical protein